MNKTKRKGARSTKDIPPEILEKLNNGKIETANIVEWFAIDRRRLLAHILLQNGRETYLKPILEHIDRLEKQTSNTISEAIGAELFTQSSNYNDKDCLQIISHHESDLVRSWGTFMIGKNTNLSIREMFEDIKCFAKDEHFNVREEAWVAIRPAVIQHLEESILILSKWVRNKNEYIRRFASEITRPRGVWCKHIEILKENPALALQIIEPLKSDSSKYVQDSVGNWLNDASKTQPIFVEDLCKRWEEESDTKETRYIIKKALRTINKAKQTTKI